jgi:hypothetical protein
MIKNIHFKIVGDLAQLVSLNFGDGNLLQVSEYRAREEFFNSQ